MSSMKKNKKKRSISKLPCLPEDIIIDILTRLPVKTLVRFRCVSKSWLNLFSNPNFINTHLLNSSKSNNFKLILWCKSIVDGPRTRTKYLKSYSLHSLFHPPSASIGDSLKLDYYFNDIVGSCNGLVCFLLEKKASLIWNPSTRESKKLSLFYRSARHTLFDSFGFGYDQRNDDYKVVQMEFNLRDGPSGKNKVGIYSLRTNSWRKIGGFPNGNLYSRMGKFSNGALHWITNREADVGSSRPFVIMSLDLENETYGEIAPPNYGVDCSIQYLIVLEGCISIFRDFSIDGRADIWVMKEYGVRDSWVKLYTIPYPKLPNKVCYLDYLTGTSATGEILLKVGNMLMIYHSKYGTFTNKIIHDMLIPRCGATATYAESLVSP